MVLANRQIVQKWPSQCILIFVSIVLLGAGTIMFAPLIIPLTVELGGIQLHGTLIEGTSRIIAAIGVIYLSNIVSAVGRRRTLMLTYFVGASGIFLSGIVPSPVFLLLTSTMVSCSFASMCAIMMVYLAELAPPNSKGMTLGIYGTAIGVSAVIGSMAGTRLAELFGLSFPFLLAGVVALLPIAIIYFFVVDSNPEEGKVSETKKGLYGLRLFPHLVRTKLLFLFLYICAFGYQFVQSSLTTLLTPLVEHLGFRLSMVGMGIGLFGIFALMQPLGGWLGDRVGRRFLAVAGALVLMFGLLRIFSADTTADILLGTGLFGLGTSLFLPSILAGISLLDGQTNRVAVMSLYQSVITLGAIFGPIGGGLALHYVSPRAPFLLNSFVIGIVGVMLLFAVFKKIWPGGVE